MFSFVKRNPFKIKVFFKISVESTNMTKPNKKNSHTKNKQKNKKSCQSLKLVRSYKQKETNINRIEKKTCVKKFKTTEEWIKHVDKQ